MSTERSDAGLYDYSARPVRPPQPNGDPGLEIDHTTRLNLYTRLLKLRQVEKRAYDLFMQKLVKGTRHPSLGMEAVSAGSARRCVPTTTSSPPIAATPTPTPQASRTGA